MRTGRLLGLAWCAGGTFCVLTVLMLTDGVASFDTAVRTGVHGFAAPPLTALALALTWLGTLGVLGVFGIVAAALLLRGGRRGDAVLLVFTMAGALILENGLKFALHRARPPPYFGVNPLTYSFPSGHALFSLCFYGMGAVVLARGLRARITGVVGGSGTVQTRGGWIMAIWTMAGALVLGIGVTRVYLGVHYPSDVVGGYLIAGAWICVVLAVERRFFPARAGVGSDPGARARPKVPEPG